jgi:transposase
MPVQELKNKYARRSRISDRKFRELIKYFALDFNALDIARLSNLNPNTVDRYLLLLRIRLAELGEADSPLRSVVELHESYFGPRRVRGKRGRGSGLKTAVVNAGQKVRRVAVEKCSTLGQFRLRSYQ